MCGIRRISLDSLETRLQGQQSTLYDVSEQTYISTVFDPDDRMAELVDEHNGSLAPTETMHVEYREHFTAYQTGMTDADAHHNSWDVLDFGDWYSRYLSNNNGPALALQKLAKRVESGEDINLVCTCDEKWACKNEIIVDAVRSIIDRGTVKLNSTDETETVPLTEI